MLPTRKVLSAPTIIPDDAAAAPADTTTKASGSPGPHHVRVQRGAGVARVIRSAAPMALGSKP